MFMNQASYISSSTTATSVEELDSYSSLKYASSYAKLNSEQRISSIFGFERSDATKRKN